MNRLERWSGFGRMVAVASVVLAVAVTAESARADHVEHGLGVVLGGIVGGAVGSAIGKGDGRDVAIGLGSALGAMYGGITARHHPRHSRHHYHPRRHARYVHPRHLHVPEVARYAPPPAPVHVHPVPAPVTVSARTEISVTVPARGHVSTAARHASGPITECRLLEGGLAPVYGCRDTHGSWRILR